MSPYLLSVAYLMVGAGVTVPMHLEFARRFPDNWKGSTLAIGCAFFVVSWPVVIVSLVTMVLIAHADQ